MRPQPNNVSEKPRHLHLDAGTVGPLRRQLLGSRGAFTLGAVSAALVCAYGVSESSARFNDLTTFSLNASHSPKYGTRHELSQVRFASVPKHAFEHN